MREYCLPIPGAPFVTNLSVITGQFVLPIPGAPFLNIIWDFDEAVLPNAVTLTNLAGAETDIDENPDTPDGGWLTAT